MKTSKQKLQNLIREAIWAKLNEAPMPPSSTPSSSTSAAPPPSKPAPSSSSSPPPTSTPPAMDEAEGDNTEDSEIIELVSSAIVSKLVDGGLGENFSSDVYEMAVSVAEDDFERPVRYEDVDHFAEKVAAAVLKDSELKDAIFYVAKNVIHGLMEPG